MASAFIHLVVSNEMNKKIKKDRTKLLIGSIAPDISKLVGDSKTNTHFSTIDNPDLPNIDKFLSLYKEHLDDDFVLGYFIHLYTDYLWFEYFLPELYDSDKKIIYKLDGTKVKCTSNMVIKYIYNDYTNINSDLVKTYNLDLDFLSEPLPHIDNIIFESHMSNLELLQQANLDIYNNSKINKDMIFNMEMINSFIKLATELTISKLKEIEK